MRLLFYLMIIISSVYLWTGCSDKDSDTAREPIDIKTKPIPQNNFQITDIDNRSTTVSIQNSRLHVAKVAQPIIVINIFADWSPPSRGMIPYLDALQKMYPKEVFVIGIATNSDINRSRLGAFMKKYNASYFISSSSDNDKLANRLASFLKLDDNYPIPLTILFSNGEYNKHYIGATPMEMIKADIEQIKK